MTPNENSTQTVALKKVQSIAVTKAPTKTEYYKGDAELDLTGMVLTVNYDGTNETRTIEGDYAAAGVTVRALAPKILQIAKSSLSSTGAKPPPLPSR